MATRTSVHIGDTLTPIRLRLSSLQSLTGLESELCRCAACVSSRTNAAFSTVGLKKEPGHTIKEKHLDKLCDIYSDGIGTVGVEHVCPAQIYKRFIKTVYRNVPCCLS